MSSAEASSLITPRPPAARPQSARVVSATPLFRPQGTLFAATTQAACTPAVPNFPVQSLPNKLTQDYQNFHAIEKEPFFWKADDPQYAPASNVGPKYDPIYTLVRPRVQSAGLKRTAPRLGIVQNKPEEQEELDNKALLLNINAVARFEREAEKQLAAVKTLKSAAAPLAESEKQAAGSPSVSPRTAAVDLTTAASKNSAVTSSSIVEQQQKITARLESARKMFTRPGTATVHYAAHVGGHWTDGHVLTGTSFAGQTCLADRTVNARLPIYSIVKASEFLLPSPRGVSFSKSERFPSPRTVNTRERIEQLHLRPSRREAVSMQRSADDSLRRSINKRPSAVSAD